MKTNTLFLLFALLISSTLHAQPFAMLKNINSTGYSNPFGFTVVGNKVFFSATDSIHGYQLWVSDGTTEGTKIAKYNPYAYANPLGMVAYNGKVYYNDNDGVNGSELWMSDGTESGTKMVKDINPYGGSFPGYLIVYNGKLYFQAQDGVNGLQLFVSDGTADGTGLFKVLNPTGDALPAALSTYNNKLYFMATDGVHGYELWSCDGSADGTQMLSDLDSMDCGSHPEDFVVFNNKMYFTANNGVDGYEFWVTDGTKSGTYMVKDIQPDGSSFPYGYTVYNNQLYFTTDNGQTIDMWVSDGTADGTKPFTAFKTTSTVGGKANSFTVYNGKLFFFANDGVNGMQLWQTDGTDAGTKIAMPGNFTPRTDALLESYGMTIFQNKLLFAANYDDNGMEPWFYNDLSVATAIHPDLSEGNNLVLFPNPGVDNVNLVINTSDSYDRAVVNFINVLGQPVQSQTIILEKGINKLSLNLGALPAGVYYAQIKNGKTILGKQMLVKQ